MVRPERGLLRLLAKLGIKSAHYEYMRISILRSFKTPNPWYIGDDEPDIMGAGIIFKEDKWPGTTSTTKKIQIEQMLATSFLHSFKN